MDPVVVSRFCRATGTAIMATFFIKLRQGNREISYRNHADYVYSRGSGAYKQLEYAQSYYPSHMPDYSYSSVHGDGGDRLGITDHNQKVR